MKTLLAITKLKKNRKKEIIFDEENELLGLCKTAGLKVFKTERIYLEKINPALYIGSGKAEELSEFVKKTGIKAIVFSKDLSATQERNLSEALNAEIFDRTYLIIKIFEQRANTPEGKIQVRLAQAKYNLSRIYGKGASMDQQVAVVGTRGAGEKKLEYQKRTLKNDISKLSKELESLKSERQVQREKRRSVPIPQISIVGYTNSGKSTLLNSLTLGKHNIYFDDRLFATLDPKTKRVKMPSGYHMLFSDTVGFISDLPPFLVAAFKSTLEEIKYCDLILHIHDLSNPHMENHSLTVKSILKEIGAENIKAIDVFNKIDLVNPKTIQSIDENPIYKSHLAISAQKNLGIEQMLCAVEKHFLKNWASKEILLPYDEEWKIKKLESLALVGKRVYEKNALRVTLIASKGNMEKIDKVFNF